MDRQDKFVPIATEHRHLPDETGCLWNGVQIVGLCVLCFFCYTLVAIHFNEVIAYWQGWVQGIFGT